jgi:hypothetical protein
LQSTPGLMLCSDGWKKKAAGQGASLVNVVLLKADGGVIFHKVEDTSGHKKTGEDIAAMHNEWAAELTKGDLAKILGVVLDNPKANRKALRLLQEEHPMWICLGCQAHALNLLCKDLANTKGASKGTAAILQDVLKVFFLEPLGYNSLI